MHGEQIRLRIWASFWRKIALSLVLGSGVWTAYLLIQRHPVFPVTAMNPTWMDRAIPFVPSSVYMYESIWLLMPIGPWLMKSKEELNRYINGLLLITLAAFAVFIFHPTMVPRPKGIHGLGGLYELLIRVDRELNAFPSLHAAFAVFHGACCHAVFSDLRWSRVTRWFVWAWVFGIIASTLLTRQHVVADAVAGVAVGFAGYALFRYWPLARDLRKETVPA